METCPIFYHSTASRKRHINMVRSARAILADQPQAEIRDCGFVRRLGWTVRVFGATFAAIDLIRESID